MPKQQDLEGFMPQIEFKKAPTPKDGRKKSSTPKDIPDELTVDKAGTELRERKERGRKKERSKTQRDPLKENKGKKTEDTSWNVKDQLKALQAGDDEDVEGHTQEEGKSRRKNRPPPQITHAETIDIFSALRNIPRNSQELFRNLVEKLLASPNVTLEVLRLHACPTKPITSDTVETLEPVLQFMEWFRNLYGAYQSTVKHGKSSFLDCIGSEGLALLSRVSVQDYERITPQLLKTAVSTWKLDGFKLHEEPLYDRLPYYHWQFLVRWLLPGLKDFQRGIHPLGLLNTISKAHTSFLKEEPSMKEKCDIRRGERLLQEMWWAYNGRVCEKETSDKKGHMKEMKPTCRVDKVEHRKGCEKRAQEKKEEAEANPREKMVQKVKFETLYQWIDCVLNKRKATTRLSPEFKAWFKWNQSGGKYQDSWDKYQRWFSDENPVPLKKTDLKPLASCPQMMPCSDRSSRKTNRSQKTSTRENSLSHGAEGGEGGCDADPALAEKPSEDREGGCDADPALAEKPSEDFLTWFPQRNSSPKPSNKYQIWYGRPQGGKAEENRLKEELSNEIPYPTWGSFLNGDDVLVKMIEEFYQTTKEMTKTQEVYKELLPMLRGAIDVPALEKWFADHPDQIKKMVPTELHRTQREFLEQIGCIPQDKTSVNVTGETGSGKTTAAALLALKLAKMKTGAIVAFPNFVTAFERFSTLSKEHPGIYGFYYPNRIINPDAPYLFCVYDFPPPPPQRYKQKVTHFIIDEKVDLLSQEDMSNNLAHYIRDLPDIRVLVLISAVDCPDRPLRAFTTACGFDGKVRHIHMRKDLPRNPDGSIQPPVETPPSVINNITDMDPLHDRDAAMALVMKGGETAFYSPHEDLTLVWIRKVVTGIIEMNQEGVTRFIAALQKHNVPNLLNEVVRMKDGDKKEKKKTDLTTQIEDVINKLAVIPDKDAADALVKHAATDLLTNLDDFFTSNRQLPKPGWDLIPNLAGPYTAYAGRKKQAEAFAPIMGNTRGICKTFADEYNAFMHHYSPVHSPSRDLSQSEAQLCYWLTLLGIKPDLGSIQHPLLRQKLECFPRSIWKVWVIGTAINGRDIGNNLEKLHVLCDPRQTISHGDLTQILGRVHGRGDTVVAGECQMHFYNLTQSPNKPLPVVDYSRKVLPTIPQGIVDDIYTFNKTIVTPVALLALLGWCKELRPLPYILEMLIHLYEHPRDGQEGVRGLAHKAGVSIPHMPCKDLINSMRDALNRIIDQGLEMSGNIQTIKAHANTLSVFLRPILLDMLEKVTCTGGVCACWHADQKPVPCSRLKNFSKVFGEDLNKGGGGMTAYAVASWSVYGVYDMAKFLQKKHLLVILDMVLRRSDPMEYHLHPECSITPASKKFFAGRRIRVSVPTLEEALSHAEKRMSSKTQLESFLLGCDPRPGKEFSETYPDTLDKVQKLVPKDTIPSFLERQVKSQWGTKLEEMAKNIREVLKLCNDAGFSFTEEKLTLAILFRLRFGDHAGGALRLWMELFHVKEVPVAVTLVSEANSNSGSPGRVFDEDLDSEDEHFYLPSYYDDEDDDSDSDSEDESDSDSEEEDEARVSNKLTVDTNKTLTGTPCPPSSETTTTDISAAQGPNTSRTVEV